MAETCRGGGEPSLEEALGSLSPGYRDGLEASYAAMDGAVEYFIEVGVLPADYRLPEMSVFAAEVATVAPVFEAMEARGWQSEVVFVPHGLSIEQWHIMLSDHLLDDGADSAGLYCSFESDIDTVRDPFPGSTPPSDAKWEVCVMAGGDMPPLRSVSPDGVHGPAALEVQEALAEFCQTDSLPVLIKQRSPSLQAYLTLQFLRLARGDGPLDTRGLTIIREDVGHPARDNNEMLSLFGTWDAAERHVRLDWHRYPKEFSQDCGVRPTVQANELLGLAS